MAITCHIFKYNALHYNYVMRKNCPLQITFHYFENVIHYNYITITITITPGLVALCKWPAFQFRCIHSLVHDKYKYNAAKIRTGLCSYRFWVKKLSAVTVAVQIMTRHWFHWRLVEQQGETILEKELFLQLI